MLNGAKFLELLLRISREKLRQHPGHGFDGKSVRGNIDRLCAHHYVGPLADVHDQRVAVGANDCGQ